MNKDVYNSISDKAKEVETVQVHLQDEDERLVKTVMLKMVENNRTSYFAPFKVRRPKVSTPPLGEVFE